MIDYTKELQNQLQELNMLLEEANNRLKKSWNVEEGKLRVCSSHGYPQYHFKATGEEKTRYIPTYEKDKIKALAQKEYDLSIKKELESSSKKLQKFLNCYDVNNIEALYEKLHQGRQILIDPIIPSQAERIEEWYRNNPGNNNTFQKDADDDNYFNASGYVRRKYPDFVLLNVRKNKTIYWEHLGRAGEELYAVRNFDKLMKYERNGLIIGDNLIITIESEKMPLDVDIVTYKIKEFLL